jgi:predicted membrane chloride channel (bestrophin family)
MEFKKMLRSLLLIINYKTWLVAFLTVFAIYTCDYFHFIGDLPITLIGTAIIFPVVFSINSAYKRREDAIMYYASLKANCLGIFMAAKNWTDKDQTYFTETMRKELIVLIKLMHDFFLQDAEKYKALDQGIYNQFDKISVLIQQLRKGGVTPSELSRIDQYLTRGINDFEKMRKIFIYRTPNSLRTYSKFFIYSFPVLYAPYFAHHLGDDTAIIGYASVVLYSFVFVSLINIQDQLENPFDQFGEDDIEFDIEEFESMLQGISERK